MDASDVGSESAFRDAFLLGAAKAFFVTAYADYCDEHPSQDLPRAHGGEDWVDVAPDPPPAAFALAGELWAMLNRDNGVSVYILADRAQEADKQSKRRTDKKYDPEDFGHCLAMEAMGHGVSWFDDHATFDLKVPHLECFQFSFSPDAYRRGL